MSEFSLLLALGGLLVSHFGLICKVRWLEKRMDRAHREAYPWLAE